SKRPARKAAVRSALQVRPRRRTWRTASTYPTPRLTSTRSQRALAPPRPAWSWAVEQSASTLLRSRPSAFGFCPPRSPEEHEPCAEEEQRADVPSQVVGEQLDPVADLVEAQHLVVDETIEELKAPHA